MLVVDASVVAVALADDGADGDRARERLARETVLAAPELLDVEVLSAFRRRALTGHLPPRRAAQAVSDLADLPLRRAAHAALLTRAWELRENLTAYGAVYVALAELLEVPLLTGDRRLAHASGPRCRIEALDGGR